MPKSSPIQTSFTAGELSDTVERPDLEKYASASSILENFVLMVEGPITRRPGTYYVGSVKDDADRTWFSKFEFNTDQAYVLEFGDAYIRFYTNNGILLNLGVPYEVSSPWSTSDLTNPDGTFALQFVPSGDVVYIAGGGKPFRKLTRFGNTNWTLVEADLQGGPFNDVNPDETTTVYASAQTGTGITLVASSSIFNASHVGSLFYLEAKNVDGIKQWEVGKSISTNDLRRSDGNVYKALNTATTGTVKPTHTIGAKYDGDTGVQWEYQHSGYGWVKITAYTSGTQVTADVKSLIPDQAVGSGNATTRWAFAVFNGVDGYPTSVSIYRERLVLARDIQIELSVSGDFENFRRKDAGQVTADMAISHILSSATVNPVKWLAPVGPDLIIGTAGGEFTMSSLTDSSAFGPANKEAKFRVGRGSRAVPPILIEDSLFYVQLTGKRLWELRFNVQSDAYAATDKMILARHIAKAKIIDMAYQREPHSVLWCVTEQGGLIGATISVEQEVTGWHRHPIGGNGVVEAVEVIPAPDGGKDQVWLIVKRTIDGSTKRYVEYLTPDWDRDENSVDELFYVDCGATYDGSPATVISGLDHLEGELVDILADGATHPQRTVSSGSITLQSSASVVNVGLACPAKWRSKRPESGSASGTGQTKTKRISSVTFRFKDTLGGKAGPSEDTADEINFRATNDFMDEPVPLYNGDISISPWPGENDTDGYITYFNDQPLPVTILVVVPRLNTQDP